MLFSAVTGIAAAAVLDVGFLLVLASIVGQGVVAARNRNLPVVGVVLALAGANALDHAGMAAQWRIAGPACGWPWEPPPC